MILPIEYNADWELIRQWNQVQTNYDDKIKGIKRLDYDNKVDDKVMLKNKSVQK